MEKFVPPEENSSLRAQSGSVVSGVRAAVLQATRHLEALAELLQLELREYGRAQVLRVVTIVVGAALLLVAYAFFCFAAVVVSHELWGFLGACIALGAVVLVNLLVGLAVLYVGIKRKPEGVAPATCRELKDDIQCVKLYLKGKEKS